MPPTPPRSGEPEKLDYTPTSHTHPVPVYPGVGAQPSPVPEKNDLTIRNERVNRELAQRFDALNQYLNAAEALLKSLKPPHSVWVYYGHDDDGTCDTLGLMKVKEQWRLVHGYDSEYNDTGEVRELQPLADCPIPVRVEAVAELAALHRAIVQAKEQFVPAVDAAIEQVKHFLLVHSPAKPTTQK